MDIFKKIFPVLVVIALSFFTIKPLFINGYFPMHDDTQPSRVFEMKEALKDGQFPVRWVADLGYGYGYPIFNFYSPLPYYFGGMMNLVGIDILVATKMMFAFGMIFAGVTMYALASHMWGKWGGILSALLYMYAPYHAVELYVRGAVGEYWAYAFIPLIVWGVIVSERNLKKGVLIGSLGFAGVILSHNIMALIASYGIGLWFIVEMVRFIITKKTVNRIQGLVFIGLLGFLLSAFFIIPSLVESGMTKVNLLTQGTNDYHDHFVYLDQLWNSSWGYAGSAPGRTDGLSFMIGKLHLLLGLMVSVMIWKRFQKQRVTVSILIMASIVSAGMMLSYSTWIWEHLPLLGYTQYPWRFLVFSTFCISLLGGGLGQLIYKVKYAHIFAGLVVVFIVFFNQKYFVPKYISTFDPNQYVSLKALKWDISKISDEYMPRDFPIPQSETELKNKPFASADGIIIEEQSLVSNRWKLILSLKEASEIVFSHAYFPSWHVVVDDKTQGLYAVNGLSATRIGPGRHIVTLYLADTWIRMLANIMSIMGLIVYLMLLIQLKANHDKI